MESCGIVTRSPCMLRLLDTIERVAALDTPILLEGETGTGKNMLARASHALSERRARPFVTIDCAALPESLAESELFGHEAEPSPAPIARTADASRKRRVERSSWTR